MRRKPFTEERPWNRRHPNPHEQHVREEADNQRDCQRRRGHGSRGNIEVGLDGDADSDDLDANNEGDPGYQEQFPSAEFVDEGAGDEDPDDPGDADGRDDEGDD